MGKADLVKKLVLIGIGTAALTAEKVDKVAKELEKQGYFNVQEGKKLVREVMGEARKTQKKFTDVVAGKVDAAMKRSPVEVKVRLKRKLKKKAVQKKAKKKKARKNK